MSTIRKAPNTGFISGPSNCNTTMDQTLPEARQFAINAHKTQKYGTLPYVCHLDDVLAIAATYNAPIQVQVAAYLHDVVEDTDVGELEIRAKFGPEVADLVMAVTKVKALSRRAGLESSLERIKAGGPDAVMLKLCDRIANVRASKANSPSMLDMYRKEHVRFKEVLFKEDRHTTMWEELERLFA